MVAPSIGPYRILEKIGAGGMGEVYLAEDSRLGRKVAIKTLPPSRIENPDARRRLLNEARTAATLNHPNIAAIYDVVEAEDRLHIVMEYAHGETLSARVRRGALRPAAVLDIALQLTDALAAAHEAGIVHRDLKSDNVLIHPNGRLKILDFGLARTHSPGPSGKIAPEDTTPSGIRSISGTPPYMSPEQILGSRIDQRSDIYSLGVVLFELLAGRRPFDHRDGVSLAAEVLAGRAPSVREHNPYVPDELARIVARAMAREPSDRYQSAQEMRADLARLSAVLSDRPTLSHPADWGPSPRPRTLPSRRPSALAGAAALAAAVTALLALRPVTGRGSASGGGDGRPPVVAVLPFMNLSSDRSDEPLGTGIADVLVSKLARVQGVALLPLSATRPYHGKPGDPKRVAADLGASYVVEGGVQRAGNHLRVTATLVDGGSGRVAWSEDFDAPTADVFALQHQLADGLAGALRLRLTPAERQRIAQPPTSNVEAFADYAQGRSFLERPDVPGSIDRAVQLLQAAIARDPRFALAHAALGEAYWAEWEATKDQAWTVKARDATAEALRLDPEPAAIHTALALIYRGTGRPAEASDELRQALERQPTSDDAHRLLGEILLEQGNNEEALSHLRAAAQARPQFWRNHSMLGFAYFTMGRYQDAVPCFRRWTELQPDSSRGYQALGTTYHAAGDTRQALVNYEKAISMADDARAYSNLGSLYAGEGRFIDAARAYEKAVALEPGTPAKYKNLGDAYRRLGRDGDARKTYVRGATLSRDLLRVNPKDAAVLSSLAVLEAKLGRPDQASRLAAEAVSLSPSNGEIIYRRAVVHALAGHPVDALKDLRVALTRGASATIAGQDYDLAILRNLPEFKELVGPRS